MLRLSYSCAGGVTNGTEMDWGTGWRELKVEERDKGIGFIIHIILYKNGLLELRV